MAYVTLTEFLEDAKGQTNGDATRRGSLIFLSLARGLDRAIQEALSLSDYHRGEPSPWSHVFLLAEDFKGPDTAIVECTIRTKDGGLIWDEDHKVTIFDILFNRDQSGVLVEKLGSYNDPHVRNVGVRWLPELSDADRDRIAAIALDHDRWASIHYDLPGLFRELLRLLSGNEVKLPPDDNLLFCSAFVQRVYDLALGDRGHFNPSVADYDTTPDDLWYLPRGSRLGPVLTAQVAVPAPTLQAMAELAMAPVRATRHRRQTTKEVLRDIIDSGLEHLASPKLLPFASSFAADPAAKNQARVEEALQQALEGVEKLSDDAPATFVNTENPYLSLLLTSIDETAPGPLSMRTTDNVPGVGAFHAADPGWLASFFNRVFATRVPFVSHKALGDNLCIPIPDGDLRFAIAGDWGSDAEPARNVAAQMRLLGVDYTIHLGDVYYSGTEAEIWKRFLPQWPIGSRGSFALNSNHEMYSGGHGYFDLTLKQPAFAPQKGASYFCLFNSRWQIIGLDSAYFSPDFLMQKGGIGQDQKEWLADRMADAVAHGRTSIVLTHHNPIDIEGKTDDGLIDDVIGTSLGHGGLKYWIWGHEHYGMQFDVSLKGQPLTGLCVGHSGIPYVVPNSQKSAAIRWLEEQTVPGTPRVKNGFLILSLGAAFGADFVDEFGVVKRHV
jgi:hypothetical protein